MLVPGTGEVRIRHSTFGRDVIRMDSTCACGTRPGGGQHSDCLYAKEAFDESAPSGPGVPCSRGPRVRLRRRLRQGAQPTKNEAKAATRAKGTAAAKRAAQSKEANPPVITKIPPNVSSPSAMRQSHSAPILC